jgi:hypothetical protein
VAKATAETKATTKTKATATARSKAAHREASAYGADNGGPYTSNDKNKGNGKSEGAWRNSLRKGEGEERSMTVISQLEDRSSPVIRLSADVPAAGVDRQRAGASLKGPRGLAGWLASLLLPGAAIWFGRSLAPWQYMWVCAFATFLGVKWLTWWRARDTVQAGIARQMAYFFLWPGMDARSFLGDGAVARPWAAQWLWALAKTCAGIALLWIVARRVPATFPLARGWVGLIGLILLLHFGSFEVLAFAWQRLGVNAVPIMRKPMSSQSLSDFWGKRWNLGFRQLSHEFVFRPLREIVGAPAAMMLVFLFSGLVHELVISVPARAGYGLPTAYFLLQGAGVMLERSSIGRTLGLRGGFSGWASAAAMTACPAFWLFHAQFVIRVVLPFMEAIRAI